MPAGGRSSRALMKLNTAALAPTPMPRLTTRVVVSSGAWPSTLSACLRSCRIRPSRRENIVQPILARIGPVSADVLIDGCGTGAEASQARPYWMKFRSLERTLMLTGLFPASGVRTPDEAQYIVLFRLDNSVERAHIWPSHWRGE